MRVRCYSSPLLGFIVTTFLLFGIYLSNRDFLQSDDVTGTLQVPLSYLRDGDGIFTAREIPQFFMWRLKLGDREFAGPIASWNDRVNGVRLSDYAAQGRLTISDARYFLVRTKRTNRNGEAIYINLFGQLPGLMCLPLFYVLQQLYGNLEGQADYIFYGGKLVASFCVALSALFLMLTAHRFVSMRRAVILGLLYGLGTSVWSISSQALWQHGPDVFFISLGIFFLVRSPISWRDALFGGLTLGLAFLARPTSALFLLSFVSFAAFQREYRHLLVPFLLGALPCLVTQGTLNAYYMGQPWTFAQTARGQEFALTFTGDATIWQTPLWKGVLGLLISPSRGVLVYSPFLLIALVGTIAVFKDKKYIGFRPFFGGGGLIFCLESKHFDWWGGTAYGPRHIVDLSIIFALGLLPFLSRTPRQSKKVVLLGAAALYSLAVQFIGAFAYEPSAWNARRAYVIKLSNGQTVTTQSATEAAQWQNNGAAVETIRQSINLPAYRYRLWSIEDNQIAYFIQHFSESRNAKRFEIDRTLNSVIYPPMPALVQAVEAYHRSNGHKSRAF